MGVKLAGCLIAALGGYVFADLYLRVDLPGAAALAHLAFRAIVAPLEWLTEGDGARLKVLLMALGATGVAGLIVPRPMRWFWQAAAALAAGAMLMVLAIAALMERALAAGLTLAIVAAALTSLTKRASSSPPHTSGRRLVGGALLAVVGAGACYWIYALFMTYGDGYPLLEWLGALHRTHGVDLLTLYAGATAAILLASAVSLLWARDGRGRRLQIFTMAAAGGLGISLLLEWALSLGGPAWTAALVVPAGLALATALHRVGLRAPAMLGWPGRALFALFPPFVLALLLVGHTYAARVFRCPNPADSPYLTRIASLSEVFRVTLFAQRQRLAISARSSRRLGWVPLDIVPAEVRYTAAGPARLHHANAEPTRLAGVPEDFVHAPKLQRFYVSLTAHAEGPDALPMERATSQTDLGRTEEINNLLLTISGDASKVTEVVGIPGMCWLNCVRWSDPERLLYLGCEDRPGLFRYDPARRLVMDGVLHPDVGDVQDIAFDPRARRLFTVSLWKTPYLTEVDQRTLARKRKVSIGGSHYDVVYDPGSDRVFASAWYGSRVRMVDAKTLQLQGRIPTGLGARALAVAKRQGLLLASSIYDGKLRICNAASGEVREALQVGGHVKDIAVDEARGVAYFWSQCGLYRLDLAPWVQGR